MSTAFCGNRWIHRDHIWYKAGLPTGKWEGIYCPGYNQSDPLNKVDFNPRKIMDIDIEREPSNMVAGPYGPVFPTTIKTTEYQEAVKAWKDYDMTDERKPEFKGGKPTYSPDPNDPSTFRQASERFLADCGLPIVPDAVDQLAEAFLPALSIICERGYHPEGITWREAGWRGLLTDIKKKSNRLWYRSWIKGGYDSDSAMDLINFAAFYYRLENRGKEWGDWGDPGAKMDRRFPIPSPQTIAEAEKKMAEAERQFPVPSDEEAADAKQRIMEHYQGKRKVKDNPQA